MILQLLAETGKTVSQLVAEIPRYFMIKSKMPCPLDNALPLIEMVKKHFANSDSYPEVSIDTRDGIRLDLPDAWVQFRPSNTEPIVRIMAESPDADRAHELIQQIQDLIS